MINHSLCWWVVCIIIGLAGPAAATPPKPMEDYIVCSKCKRYCADVKVSGKIDVFKKEKGQKNTSYSLTTNWSPYTYLSDDGKNFILINELISEDISGVLPAVKVWVNGVLNRTLYLEQIWNFKTRKPPPLGTDGCYIWIVEASFDGLNRFVIQLHGDSKSNFHNGPKYVIDLE